MTTTATDRIEKQVTLRAPRSRVWRAITDSKEFGDWFQAAFTDPFRPGARVKGRITHPGYEHLTMEIVIEKMVPERLFSFHWHPYAIEPEVDYSKEPTTLIEFTLEEVAEGTVLRVTESGFDQIPIERRTIAFKANNGGWEAQMKAIAGYLERTP